MAPGLIIRRGDIRECHLPPPTAPLPVTTLMPIAPPAVRSGELRRAGIPVARRRPRRMNAGRPPAVDWSLSLGRRIRGRAHDGRGGAPSRPVAGADWGEGGAWPPV